MKTRILAAAFVLVALTPAAARADGLIVPFYAVNFGGDSGQSLSSGFDANRSAWGVSFGWMGGGIVGLEGDFGYTPDFYGKTDAGGSSAYTFMGNLLLGVPFGGQQGFGIRPYGLIGAGIVKSDVDSFDDLIGLDDSDGVWDVGGGVMIFFASHVGFRGDVRYIRSFNVVDLLGLDADLDSSHLDYTRGSAGFIFRF
jgi:hypothetical protein